MTWTNFDRLGVYSQTALTGVVMTHRWLVPGLDPYGQMNSPVRTKAVARPHQGGDACQTVTS